MAKISAEQELAAYDRMAGTIGGAGVGFWAATIFSGGMPMERFYVMNGIAIALMFGGPLLGWFLKKRHANKAGHGQSQEA